jgi:hypothetical protein
LIKRLNSEKKPKMKQSRQKRRWEGSKQSIKRKPNFLRFTIGKRSSY